MRIVPAGIAALVTVYCLVCVLRPGWRDPGNRVDVDLGHSVMGATTVVMVLGILPVRWVPGLLVLFGAATVGCAIRGFRQVPNRPGYLRLGVLCAAMLPMLVPGSATAAPATSTTPHDAGHLMSMATDTAMSSPAVRAVDLLLIAALLVLTAARLTGSSRTGLTLHCRLHSLCEVAMAATTGCLLASML